MQKLAAIFASVIALAALLLFVLRPSPLEQAQYCFDTIGEQLSLWDAGAVIDRLHPDYDFATLWPKYLEFAKDHASAQAKTDREIVRSFMARYFFGKQQQGAQLSCSSQVTSIQERDDGFVDATVDISIDSQGAGVNSVSYKDLNFTLAPRGLLWPELLIYHHQPISVR